MGKPAANLIGAGLGFLDRPLADLPAHVQVLVQNLPLSRRTCVVDVGANPNEGTDAPYRQMLGLNLCDVVGFEPQLEAFADLEKIKGPRETYFPFAVGNGGACELKVFAMSGFTSIFEPDEAAKNILPLRNWQKITARVPFDTVRLDDAAGVPRFDLLKIDIQGGEGEVFAGAVERLKTAAAVIVELRYFGLYAGEPLMAGIDSQLRSLGFKLHKLLPIAAFPIPNSQQNRIKNGRLMEQVIDGDAVYIRDLSRMAEADDELVVHLALLAAIVFNSQSLAVHCLDELVRRDLVAPELPARYADALPHVFRPKKSKGR